MSQQGPQPPAREKIIIPTKYKTNKNSRGKPQRQDAASSSSQADPDETIIIPSKYKGLDPNQSAPPNYGSDKIIIPTKYKSKRPLLQPPLDPQQSLLWQLLNAPGTEAPIQTRDQPTLPEAPFEERIVIPSKYREMPALGRGPVGDAEMSDMEKTLVHKISFPPLFEERPPLKKPVVYKSRWYRAAQNPQPKSKWRDTTPPRLKLMKARYRNEDFNLIDEHGNIKIPKLEVDDILEEQLRKEKREYLEERAKADTVTWAELMSEDYQEKQREKAKKKQEAEREKKRLLKRQKALERQKCEEQQIKLLQSVQTDLPIDPDEQRAILLDKVHAEQSVYVSPADVERIEYYMSEGFPCRLIPPYSEAKINMFARAKKVEKEFGRFPRALQQVISEVQSDYETAMKKAAIYAKLSAPAEQVRLNILTHPRSFPALVIRGPISWHTNVQLAKHNLDHNLFTLNQVIVKLNQLCVDEFRDKFIVPREALEKVSMPLLSTQLESITTELCDQNRTYLTEEWLSKCCELLVEHADAWKPLVPLSANNPSYKQTICSSMSVHLRRYLMNSIEHFLEIVQAYSEGNDFTGNLTDLPYENVSLLTLEIVVDKTVIIAPPTAPDPTTAKPGTDATAPPEPAIEVSFGFKPALSEAKDIIRNVFKKMINSCCAIPRVEVIAMPNMENMDLCLQSVNAREDHVKSILEEAERIVEANMPGPSKYLTVYNKFLFIVNGEAESKLNKVLELAQLPELEQFDKMIDSYKYFKTQIGQIKRIIPLNLFEIYVNSFNETMFGILDGYKERITGYFLDDVRNQNRIILNEFEDMKTRVSEIPDTTVELVNMINYIQECKDTILDEKRQQIGEIGEKVLFLIEKSRLEPTDIEMNSKIFRWLSKIGDMLEDSIRAINTKRESVETSLELRVAEFDKLLKEHSKMLTAIEKSVTGNTTEEFKKAHKEVLTLLDLLQKDRATARQINEEQELLKMVRTNYETVDEMLERLEPFDQLWSIILEFRESSDLWMEGPFKGLNADEIKEKTDFMFRELNQLARKMTRAPGCKMVNDLTRSKLESFRKEVPILQCISNPGMEERHWKILSDELGQDITPNDQTSLKNMLDLGIRNILPKLEEVSLSASKEAELSQSLNKMVTEWSDIKLDVVPYRDTGTYIIQGTDEIQVMLDDHILRAQTMRGSPYIKPFETEMEAWESKLINMQDILDIWLQVQGTWMYLEPIFSSEDIMRQMPEESRNFKTVDQIWKTIMLFVNKDPHILQATEMEDMLKNFNKCNLMLELIQKGLNDYLEKKRLFFPRFFFLSNDELLEILSETKDPLRVQPHLKKIFEGINLLEYSDSLEIIGMISLEGEKVALSGLIRPNDAKGLVEKWLQQVEDLMIKSLQDICMMALGAYYKSERVVWVTKWPGMVVICVSSITWTAEVEKAIQSRKLDAMLDKSVKQIDIMVIKVRGKLLMSERITICALIVIDVHAKEVVASLVESKVTQVEDFAWMSQLRYYNVNNLVNVCMITTTVQYGYEYLGNSDRLVITPLTDRCYRTLMSALKLHLGGAPEGPAGTGKTETSKDLAKAVAKQCIVFNCSDTLDYKAMGKFFKGVASAGAWACFDEFNRIELEVLSVVAQQVQSIQLATIAKLKKFMFEGTEISLNPTSMIFITMNPGYAGRTELPDNLKVLFRSVAMMVPDYAMIGEISLYSMGFQNAKILAEKIVYTYKLCSEQLSSQSHYDYGMRAVKSVLNAAGSLKIKYPEKDEFVIVLRAIIDVNMPKFLVQDLPLFIGIYKDLFPGIELPPTDRDELIEQIKINLAKRNAQATDWYIEKIIQVYEMILVRHGLMVVGESFGGKTTAYQTLADSLTDIAAKKSATMKEFKTGYKIINPKSITMGQLYGEFDSASHEWRDGILAKTFREMAVSTTPDRKWIMFDGPIDAVWIENMNTVLDDNKKLCLINGEIIKMSNTMNLIFECENLEFASPATVSRVGMIYFELKCISWTTFFLSYQNELKEKLNEEQFEMVTETVDYLLPACFDFIRTLPTFVATSDIHLFQNFVRLFSCMIVSEQLASVSRIWLLCTLLFCVPWAMGATMTDEAKIRFDVFYRKLILGEDDVGQQYPRPAKFKFTKHQSYPDAYTIFDYFYDKRKNGQWMTWLETVERPTFPPNLRPSDLIIPTNVTCMQNFFINLYLQNDVPMMFVGPTGTGKSTIVLNLLLNLSKDKYLPNIINFSARTSSNITQEMIMAKLDRRRKGVYGPAMGKKYIVFIDDLNMPQKETYGAQPAVELLRQIIDHKHLYDFQTVTRVDLKASHYGGRLLRHMNIISIDSFNEATLSKIFTSVLDWHFSKGFTDSIVKLSKNIVAATFHVYSESTKVFLPIPSKSHYVFNLRDFAKVIMGLTQLPASHCKAPDKMYKLWTHEILRVFSDRLVDETDKQSLLDMMKYACQNIIGTKMDEFLKNKITDKTISADDLSPLVYDEIDNLDLLTEKINQYIVDYNTQNSNKPIDIVTFLYIIQHISRLCRILQQPKGHAMLITIGGSGAAEVTKLATFMNEYVLFEIEILKTYGLTDWRDIPNLLPSEDKIAIQDQMAEVARKTEKKIDTTPLALYNFFIERVQLNLHVALIFSPIGEAFRNRLRQFPSLINCSTIDWFTSWPEDALEKVAQKSFLTMPIDDMLKQSCVSLCKSFHKTVEESADEFYERLKRKYYVTPIAYMELLKTFKQLYGNKMDEIRLLKERYNVGLTKLEFAAGQVSEMSEELTALKPQLEVTSVETEKLMVKIEQDTVQVEATKEIVGADEALANEAAAASQAIKDDCESDLAEAIPALKAAESALGTLKAADITIVKSMKNPPSAVKLVLEAICVMKGVKSVKKPDPSGSGKMIEDWWEPSLKLLGDSKFLQSLQEYNKDNIDPAIMKVIRSRFANNREFDPEVIKNVSLACEGLCKWVLAMEVYDRVIKIVGPKKAKLAEAEADYAVQMEKLNSKRAQLATVLGKLQALRDELAQKSKDKKELEDQIELCKQKLERAEKLIGGLGGEKTRWSEASANLSKALVNCIGDILICAGIITYLGAFTVDFRNDLIEQWKSLSSQEQMPFTLSFSMITTLGDAVKIRSWNINGLPVDNFSIENGIILFNSNKWPLLIDPQGQANKWLKNVEKGNLSVVKLTDATLLRTLERAIRTGTAVLLENIQETIDSSLEPVLLKSYYKIQNQLIMTLNNKEIEYNIKFRLYITTRLKNPHYIPEILTKITLINFMITPQGLQNQLLGIVVAKEKPDLETKKNELIIESANNKKILKETEDKILEVLSSSQGNILEDESAEIDDARMMYIPVSKHSSVLFFCCAELSNIDPMYQYSLNWFINLYVQSIEGSEKTDQLDKRLKILMNHFTYSIYKNICRSLFEDHKLVFSFVLCTGIQRSNETLDETLFKYFLTGSIDLTMDSPNPSPSWLSNKTWTDIIQISKLPQLGDLKASVKTKNSEWKSYYDSKTPEKERVSYVQDKSDICVLNILKIIRPDKVIQGIQIYVSKNLGEQYIVSPPFSLKQSYDDSNCCTPLIFILSAGSDPMDLLLKFNSDMNAAKPLTVSLGQGQGEIAKSYIDEGLKKGLWIVLQNCHVAKSWMKELERICAEVIVPANTHQEFRLWLTSYPSTTFPVSVLENGIKMIIEPPKGIKNNLFRSYTNDPINSDDFYNDSKNVAGWHKLLFSLCLFHAVVQERKQYGPLGWNIPYEFNLSDLNISMKQLQMFLNDYTTIPFDALIYLTGECNYGGRVTDDKDRRLMVSLLKNYYNADIVEQTTYAFSPSKIYRVPSDTSLKGIQSYIQSLPLNNTPEIFGLHENADLTKNFNETRLVLGNILLCAQQGSTPGAQPGDAEAKNVRIIDELLGKFPEQFDEEAAGKKYPILYNQSMNTELIRYNRLTVIIKKSLQEVRQAVKGLIVMSKELEEINTSIMFGKIPQAWASKSYPSLKPLGSYIVDLLARLNFFQVWIDTGIPQVFWLSGFYFTQSFLTGILQNYSRRRKVPIDQVGLEFEVTLYEITDQPKTKLDIGVYCSGLFLEGARWDRVTRELGESLPNILYDQVPIIWFKPGMKNEFKKIPSYDCPIYKTGERRGILSTTGHSTNFVMWIVFPTSLPQEHWINRGVAALCQLND
ncbi:hypothetical protein M8J76_000435 [Diaphorina citri]|nr:hypothetical protein M8J76_000435 [Diaphorina citri]